MNTSSMESEMFPSNMDWDKFSQYSGFTLVHEGSYAKIIRAQKAGKYFLLKAPKDNSSYYLNIIKREYEISLGLDHPNITSAFTFELIEGLGPCLIMEYIDGDTLTDYLAAGPSVKARKKVLSQLLSAVDYLHKRNIIHNDLKPENIIISKQEGNLKLIDFGLSDDDAHYLAKSIGCTPSYASPELLSGKDVVDSRSDIYSLGKLIHLLFPSRYYGIVNRCTKDNPKHRIQSVQSIETAIKRRKVFAWSCLTLVIIGAAFICFRPDNLSKTEYEASTEYETSIEKAETRFKELCKEHDIEVENIPQMSRVSYFEISESKQERQDSLSRLFNNELNDRILLKNGQTQIDSIYNLYKDDISNQPFQIFGSQKAARFEKQAVAIRDSIISGIIVESNKGPYYSSLEYRFKTYRKDLDGIVDSLPDFSVLDDADEMQFYFDLAMSNKPYRKYKKQ